MANQAHERLTQHLLAQGQSLESAREPVHNLEERRTRVVNCWPMNRGESYLMWRVYSDRGFASGRTLQAIATVRTALADAGFGCEPLASSVVERTTS